MIDHFYTDNKIRITLFKDSNLRIYIRSDTESKHYYIVNVNGRFIDFGPERLCARLQIKNKKEILNYCIKGIQEQIKNNNCKYISSLMRLVAFREDLNEKENNNK